jgi:hypothetical protein
MENNDNNKRKPNIVISEKIDKEKVLCCISSMPLIPMVT